MHAFFARFALTLLVLFTALCGVACGGDDPAAAAPSTPTLGAVSIAITDAASDDLESFQVEITGITLTRLNGASVALLTEDLTVDLVSLSDLSEIVNSTEIPAGVYTAATITIDYTAATARINGESTDAAIVDTNGADLTTAGEVETDITFPSGSLTVAASAHRMVEFDYDLDSSVTVDTTTNTVTVAASVVVRVDRTDPKPFILGGELVSVDATASTFELEVKRPGGATVLATVTCGVDTATVFQIDGAPATGAAGLTALEAAGAGTWVQALATADAVNHQFDVTYVEAGSGTLGSGADLIEGHVIARTGVAGADPVLTVRGHSIAADGSSFSFNTSFTVTLSFANTAVVRRSSSTDYDTDDINIGQAIQVYGDLTAATTMTANTAGSLVRMWPTKVFGFAGGAPAGGVLTIEVTRIGIRNISLFDFDVGGADVADPLAFVVDIGSLPTLSITTDTPVQAQGFFPAVDAAGEDFEATSLSNWDDVPSAIRMRWNTGTTTALTFGTLGITFDISAANVAVLDQSFVGTVDLTGTPIAAGNPTALIKFFTIVEDGAITIVTDFSTFSDDLEARLGAGSELIHFSGLGTLNSTTNIFTGNVFTAILTSP